MDIILFVAWIFQRMKNPAPRGGLSKALTSTAKMSVPRDGELDPKRLKNKV
jgi:hypothetical protein